MVDITRIVYWWASTDEHVKWQVTITMDSPNHWQSCEQSLRCKPLLTPMSQSMPLEHTREVARRETPGRWRMAVAKWLNTCEASSSSKRSKTQGVNCQPRALYASAGFPGSLCEPCSSNPFWHQPVNHHQPWIVGRAVPPECRCAHASSALKVRSQQAKSSQQGGTYLPGNMLETNLLSIWKGFG